MAGQCCGALSQPLFLSTPAVVAANWCVCAVACWV
jgi:hypothetical protein